MPRKLLRLPLLLSLLLTAHCLQFDVLAGTKRCFTDEIPPSTAASLSYVVVDGEGDLPLTLVVTHLSSGAIIFARDNIDTLKFSFQTPPASAPDFAHGRHQALPASSGWAVEPEDGTTSPVRGAGAGNFAAGRAVRLTDEYSFCFGKTLDAGSGVFHIFPVRRHLRSHGASRSRRVLFDLIVGAAATKKSEVEGLAKELHLTESDRLSAKIHSHVEQVVARVDEMRSRADEMDRLSTETGRLVRAYSVLACGIIVLGAGVSAYGSHVTLMKQKEF